MPMALAACPHVGKDKGKRSDARSYPETPTPVCGCLVNCLVTDFPLLNSLFIASTLNWSEVLLRKVSHWLSLLACAFVLPLSNLGLRPVLLMAATSGASSVSPSARRDSNHSIQPSPMTSPSPSFYEIFYHASCKHCKHHHTALPVKLPKDPSKHFRLHCERCKHSISGFGLNSTQTTLVSEESLDFNRRNSRSSITSANNSLSCSNNATLSSFPLRSALVAPNEAPQLVGPLSPISEDSTALGRNSTNPRSQTREPRSADVVASDQPLSSVQILPQPVQPEGTIPSPGQRGHKRGRLRRIMDSLNKLSPFPRSRRTSSFGVHWRLLFRREAKHRTKAPMENNGEILPDPHDDIPLAEVAAPTEHHSASDRENAVNEQIPESPPQLGELVRTHSEVRAAKKERIRDIRSQKTSQRAAERAVICQCDTDCHCMSRNLGSNSAEIGQTSSSDMDLPLHPVEATMRPPASMSEGSEESYPRTRQGSLAFAGIGAQHYQAHNRSTTPETSSSTAVSSQDPSGRGSVSTTAVGSNGSSNAFGRRPRLDRSTSMPAPPRRIRSQNQSRLRGSSRNRSNLRFAQDADGPQSVRDTFETSRTEVDCSSPSDMSNPEFLSQRHSIDGTLSGVSNHSATRLNGVGERHHQPTFQNNDDQNLANASSEERTPRPRSQVVQTDPTSTIAQPELDLLSQGLEELSSERTGDEAFSEGTGR